MSDEQEMRGFPNILERFLARRLPQARSVKISDCRRLTGGYACITTRFTATIDGTSTHLLARINSPPGQGFSGNTDRMAEWRLLSALTNLGTVPMPKALFADEDGSELGAKGMVLEFAEGGSFLAKLRSTGAEDRPAQAKALAEMFADIHAVDLATLPASVEAPKDWNNYIDGMIDTWLKAEQTLSTSIPMLRYIAAWLDENRPPPMPLGLVHGEPHSSNQVLDKEGRLLAIDWEYAHIGDPREDLGYCKLVELMQPPALISRDVDAFCGYYRERSGLSEEIVNPRTVDYFTVLPGIKVYSTVLRQLQDFAEGSNGEFVTCFVAGAVIVAFEEWSAAMQRVDAAKPVRSGTAA